MLGPRLARSGLRTYLGAVGAPTFCRRTARSVSGNAAAAAATAAAAAMASDDEDRVRASLQAFVVGEALAMPVHWFYDPVKLEQEYGRVDKMMAPKRSHAESFMTSMEYKGSIDILFDKAVFYEGFDIEHIKSLSKEDREALSSDVGIFVNSGSDERPHYHLSLKKGQNTANVCVARLLMRYLATVNKGGKDRYDPKEFIEAFRDYMTTDPREHPDDIAQIKAHNDAYLDVYVRKFFENASNGLPLTVCAYDQRDRWSIGSLDGLVMAVPLIAAYRHEPEAFLVGRALEHQVLTHRSVTISAVVTVLVPLLQQLWRGEDPDKALDAAMDKMRPPAITGPQMLETYKANMGPDYIPKWDKWDQHMVSVPDMTLRELVHDLIAQDKPLQDVAGFHRGEGRFSTTCYCEQAMSIVLFLATKYGQDLQAALQANAELGGHSTARGAILGAIIGARVGTDAIPRDWLAGLAAPDQVVNEIDALLGASTKAAR